MLCNLLISDQFINDKRMSKTLEEAFRELIMRNKWYEHSLRSPIQAKNDKEVKYEFDSLFKFCKFSLYRNYNNSLFKKRKNTFGRNKYIF